MIEFDIRDIEIDEIKTINLVKLHFKSPKK